MTDKEIIKAEIERRKKELPPSDLKTTIGADSIRMNRLYDELLSFIDSMEEEPARNCEICPESSACALSRRDKCVLDENPISEDLYEELDWFLSLYGPVATHEECAKHFANWGKHQAERDNQANSMTSATSGHLCPKESKVKHYCGECCYHYAELTEGELMCIRRPAEFSLTCDTKACKMFCSDEQRDHYIEALRKHDQAELDKAIDFAVDYINQFSKQ